MKIWRIFKKNKHLIYGALKGVIAGAALGALMLLFSSQVPLLVIGIFAAIGLIAGIGYEKLTNILSEHIAKEVQKHVEKNEHKHSMRLNRSGQRDEYALIRIPTIIITDYSSVPEEGVVENSPPVQCKGRLTVRI